MTKRLMFVINVYLRQFRCLQVTLEQKSAAVFGFRAKDVVTIPRRKDPLWVTLEIWRNKEPLKARIGPSMSQVATALAAPNSGSAASFQDSICTQLRQAIRKAYKHMQNEIWWPGKIEFEEIRAQLIIAYVAEILRREQAEDAKQAAEEEAILAELREERELTDLPEPVDPALLH